VEEPRERLVIPMEPLVQLKWQVEPQGRRSRVVEEQEQEVKLVVQARV
jgi:hypothetical protein